MVTQINTPWTLAAKDEAILKTLERNYEVYFANAAIYRSYFPHNVPERDLLRKYATEWLPKIRPKVRKMIFEMLKGYLAVESFVDDYVLAGARAARNKLTILKNTYQWGFEERRHGQIFRYCLIDSGMMTQRQVDAFLDQCARDKWTFERQTGMEATAWNSSAYTIVQEKHTRHNYTKFRLFLMAEYTETKNPLLEVLARMVRYVEIDEGAHEGNFRAIARVYQQYRPDLFITALRIALDSYTMPLLEYPGRVQFEQAIIASKVFSRMEFGREVFFPAMKGMGFKNTKAVARAEKAVQDLPENAVIQIQGKPLKTIEEGAVPYELTPEGIFVPLILAA